MIREEANILAKLHLKPLKSLSYDYLYIRGVVR